MTDSNITKIVSIVMALIVVFAVVAPVVSAMSTTTTTTTVEHVYGNNSLAPYTMESAQTVRGDLVPTYGFEFGELDTSGQGSPVWTPTPEGPEGPEGTPTDVRYYGNFNQALDNMSGTILINEDDVAYIQYNGVWGQAICPAVGAVTVLTEFTNLDTGVGMGIYLKTTPVTDSALYTNIYFVDGVTDSNGVRISTVTNDCTLYTSYEVEADTFQ